MQNLLKKIKLEPQEKILTTIKHCVAVILPNLLMSFVGLILVVWFLFKLLTYGWWGIAAFLFLFVSLLFYIWRLIYLWKNNFVVITNKRIVDVEKSGFWRQTITVFEYPEIKNASINIKGLVQKVFGFGSVILNLNQEPGEYELYHLRAPQKVLETINKQLSRKEQRSALDYEQDVQRLLADFEQLPIQYQDEIKSEINKLGAN